MGTGSLGLTLIAYEFDEPFAALMSSSARHSATDLTLRKADSRVCEGSSEVKFRMGNDITYTRGEESDRLVDPAQWRDIDSLATDGSLGANTGGVLTRTGVDNGVDENLDWVLVGEEVDDLERVRDDADGEELLAVVATLHHQACEASAFRDLWCRGKDTPVNQSLNDGHLRLLELLLGITAGGVREVDGVADLDVVGQGDVLDLDTVELAVGSILLGLVRTERSTHSWVSHFPKSLTSDPSLETSLGRVCTAAILMVSLEEDRRGERAERGRRRAEALVVGLSTATLI